MSKADNSIKQPTRIETDSLGSIEVAVDKLWGAQTQRALKYFHFGSELFPVDFIRAFALVKKAAALSHGKLRQLEPECVDLIVKVCDEITEGTHDDQFPLSVWQSGSGTQTNMNLNEVIANRCNEIAGNKRGGKSPVHPNDHVNRSQSTNDVFPTVMHLSACMALRDQLYPALRSLIEDLAGKAREFDSIIKTGRTHMMDATPLTLGQEFGAFQDQLEAGLENVQAAEKSLRRLAIGGTAVGTGLNTVPGWAATVCGHISDLSGMEFTGAENKFSQIAAHDALVQAHSTINVLAGSLLKILNDLRLMNSGPRCGLSEIRVPANEPGSSIMPGKVNPTQIESASMICLRIMGNNLTVNVAGSQGQFQLNAYKPLIIYTTLESIRLLSTAIRNFTRYCMSGISVDRGKLDDNINRSLMLVTALNPIIGYDNASRVAKYAYENNTTLRAGVIKLGLMEGDEYDARVDVKKMLGNTPE